MVSETSSGGAELADVVLGEEKFWKETETNYTTVVHNF